MYKLPDGSGFFVGEIDSPYQTFFQKWKHKLFHCPTFWRLKPAFQCPECGKKYRCYWEGNDTKKGINFCGKCANENP